MSRIWVLSRDRFPGERAHSINQIRMCDGFADCGHPVTLLFPDHPFRFKDDIGTFYGVRNAIEYRPLPCSYIRAFVGKDKGGRGWLGRWGERINTDLVGLSTSLSILKTLFRASVRGELNDGDIIYGRSGYFSLIGAKVLMRLLGRRVKVAVEIHIPPKGRLGLLGSLIARLDHVFVISGNLKKYFLARGHDKVDVLPDGVDMANIKGAGARDVRQEMRRKLGVSEPESIVCYAGHLYPYKGVEDLIDAAGGMPEVVVLIIGGMPADVERCKAHAAARGYDNMRFTGFVRPGEIAQYLAAADVCVYTLKPDAEIKDYTSPIKLFEYLASGNATVAASVPGVREIISPGKNGELYEPGNTVELRDRLSALIADDERRIALGEAGVNTAREFSWTARAQKVLKILATTGREPLSSETVKPTVK